MTALKSRFRPEFLNRIDEFVVFKALSERELKSVVKLEILKVEKRLLDRDIRMQISERALEWLVRVGYDPMYGARPLKRTIQREVETPISKEILSGAFGKGTTIDIDFIQGDRALTISRGVSGE